MDLLKIILFDFILSSWNEVEHDYMEQVNIKTVQFCSA